MSKEAQIKEELKALARGEDLDEDSIIQAVRVPTRSIHLSESQKMALEGIQVERMRAEQMISERFGRLLRAIEVEHEIPRGTLVIDQTRQGLPIPQGAQYALDIESGEIRRVEA